MKTFKFKDVEKVIPYEELVKLDNVLSNKIITGSSIGKGSKIVDKNAIFDEFLTNTKLISGARANTAVVDSAGAYDYTEIQTAIDYVNGKGGGTIKILPGTYTLTDNITMYSNVTLEGRTPQDTVINFNTNAKSILIKGTSYYATGTITIASGETTVVGVGTSFTGNITTGHSILLGGSNWFQVTAVTDNTHLTIANKYFGAVQTGATYKSAIVKNNVELKNLTVAYSGGIGIDAQYVNNLKMSNVFSLYHVSDAIKLDVTNWNILDYVIAAHSGGRGIYINEMYNSSCNRFFLFNNTGTGFEVEGSAKDNVFGSFKAYNNAIGMEINTSINNLFDNLDVQYNTGIGINLNGATSSSITGVLNNNGSDGIKLEGNSDNIVIANCLVEDNTGWGINISAGTCDNTLINGCSLSGNSAGNFTDSGTGTVVGTNVGIGRASSTAGDSLKASANTERSSVATTYTKIKEITSGAKGQLRVKFDLKALTGATAYGKIYRDGVAVGTEQTDVTAAYVNKSEDITGWGRGNKVQLYIKTSSGAVKVQSYDTGDDTNGFEVWGANDIAGQTFTASESYEIVSVEIKGWRYNGDPGTVTMEIQGITGGDPDNSALTSGTFAGSTVGIGPSNKNWVTCALTPYTLTSGVQYAIVMKATNASQGSSSIWWMSDTTSPSFTGGNSEETTDGGTNWTADTGEDFMFRINASPKVSVQNFRIYTSDWNIDTD